MSFIAELKRRNVLRVGAAYVVTAWLIVQVVETLFPMYGLSEAAARTVVNVLAIGLVPVLVLSWVFEWTPEGLKRDSEVEVGAPASVVAAKRLDRIILIVLAMALGYFAFDKFVLDPARDVEMAETARQEGRSEALIDSYGDASIAVLAFENMSPDPDQAYFADGISEEILNLLAAIPELRVISRSSAFTYKGRDVPVSQIARELNVVHVLEGSVRKAGNQVRVTAQLIDGRSDTHLWSRTWDRSLENVFAIQDEIAADVVAELELTLTHELPASKRTNPEAYTLTLQARQLSELSLADGSLRPQILDLLEEVLLIDPTHVPAMELMLINNYHLMRDGLMSSEEERTTAESLRERILTLDPGNLVIASYRAWETYEYERDIEGAASAFAAMLPRALNHAEVLRVIGGFLRRIGELDKSIAVLKRCVAVDPLKLGCSWQLKESYLWAGKLEQSRINADRLNRFFGREAGGHDVLRMLLAGQARQAEEIALKLERDPIIQHALLALAARDLGNVEGFERYLAAFNEMGQGFEPGSMNQEYWVSQAAGLHAHLGNMDSAFEYLRQWATEFDRDAYRNAMSPWYLPLHGDQRWATFLESVGLGEARLAAIEFPLPPQLKMGSE